MAEEWYPPRLAARIPWHANYKTETAASGTTYGMTAGEVTQAGTDADAVPLAVNYAEAVVAFAQEVTEWRDIVLEGDPLALFPPVPAAPSAPTFVITAKPGIEKRTRQFAGQNKASATYTQAVGEAYGIVAPVGVTPVFPKIDKATAVPGSSNVALDLFKGSYDLVAVDMQRGGSGWTQIGLSQQELFTDTTPALVAGQPEQRNYRVQGVKNNVREGDLSPTVSVVTVP